MNVMKVKSILICFIFLLGLLCGCSDFLKEDPSAKGTAESYFPTPKGFDAALNACYSSLRHTNNEKHLWIWGTDQFSGTNGYPTSRDPGTYANLDVYAPSVLNSDNASIKNFWERHYIGVDRCNRVISMGPTANLSAAEVATKVAEATTLRAWYYYQLVEQFGAIPFPLEPYTTLQTTAERIPEETIYAQLISDLEAISASGALPDKPAQSGRVTKAACWMVLSKLYLTRGWKPFAQPNDFANAAKYADKIIQESPYKLLSDYQMIFHPGNEKNDEVILAIQWSRDQTLAKWDWDTNVNNWGNNWHSKFGIAYDNFQGGIRSNYYNRGLRTYNETFHTVDCFGVDTLTHPGKSYVVPPLLESLDIFPTNYSYKIDSRYDASLCRLCMVEKTIKGSKRYGPDTKVHWVYAAPNTVDGQEVPLVFNQANVGININHWVGTGRDTCLFFPRPDETYLWPAERYMDLPYGVVPRATWFLDNNGPVRKMFTDKYTYYNGNLPGSFWWHVDWLQARPWMFKFWDPFSIYNDNWGVRDMILMRVGEAYLIAAEAYYKMGNLSLAADRINTIRQRACKHSNPHYMDVAPSDVTIDFILDERTRELAGEEYRWVELKRTGKLIERTLKYNWWANSPFIPGGKPYLSEFHLLRPLPYSWWSLLTNKDEVPNNPGY